MTRKDYNKAASIARDAYKGEAKCYEAIVEAFVELFRGDNPRFDANRFRTACEPERRVDGFVA